MTACEMFRQQLNAGPDRVTADIRTHAIACEDCGAWLADRALAQAQTEALDPPAGFARLVAIRARATVAPPRRSRPGLWTALAIVAIDLALAAVWVSGRGLPWPVVDSSQVTVAMASVLLLAEAAMVLGGWVVLSQAPPTRRRA